MVHYIAQAFCVRRDGSVASRKVVNLVRKLLGVDRHDGPGSTSLARSSHSAGSRLGAVHEPLWSAHGDCEAWGPIYSRAHFCHHVWSPFMKGDARRCSLHGLGSRLHLRAPAPVVASTKSSAMISRISTSRTTSTSVEHRGKRERFGVPAHAESMDSSGVTPIPPPTNSWAE